MDKLKIWFLSAYDQPKGHSSRTYDYAMELAELGHRVTIFTNSYSHFTHEEHLESDETWREEMVGPVSVIWLRTPHYSDNGWRRGANMLCNAWRAYAVGGRRRESPNVVIGPSVPMFTGFAAYMLARRRNAAFCFEVRDIWPQALIDLGVISERSFSARAFRWLEVFLYSRADRISAVLPLTYSHVEKAGVSGDKVTWIPNGVNLRRFANTRSYDGGKVDEIAAMYVGGFSVTHSVETILHAARLLQEEGETGVRFIVVGGGRDRVSCEDEAGRLGLNRVRFVDVVPKDDVPGLQEQADVLIASVKDTPVYQFGINSNKIYDYLASGRPIIFAGNAPNDPVVEASAGISVPPEDPRAMANALLEMLRMPPTKRQELGENGRRYAEEHFDTKKLARRMELMLTQAVEARMKKIHS